MPHVRPADAPVTRTIYGPQGEVLSYVMASLDYLGEAAERTHTQPPWGYRHPLERIEHLESLVRCVRAGLISDPEHIPSPHYLRALAVQSIAWLQHLYERGEVSW